MVLCVNITIDIMGDALMISLPNLISFQGGEEQGGMRFYAPSQMRSVKDIAGFTTMKYRQEGQASIAELKRKDLRSELEDKERKHGAKSTRESFIGTLYSCTDVFESRTRVITTSYCIVSHLMYKLYHICAAEKEQDLRLLEYSFGPGDRGPPVLVPKAIDADIEADDEDVSDDSVSDDDDDDDEAELLAELARIKREREEQAARKALEESAAAEAAETEETMRGNPLLQEKLAASGVQAASADFAMKRRWDDDVVFRNQARTEPKKQRRFVNDTLRSDFHRRFLERYIK